MRITTQMTIALAAWFVAPVAAQDFKLTVDVPGSLGGTTYLAQQTMSRSGGTWTLDFDGTGNGLGADVNINALLELEDGAFLFSTDAPFEARGTWFEARDIVRQSGGNYSLEVSGALLGLGAACNIDALSRDTEGNLIVSFDAPETVGSWTFEPEDLAVIVNGQPELFLSGQDIRLPEGANVVGYEWEDDGDSYFLFDTPVEIGSATYLPGDIVVHDGTSFALYFADPGFPPYAAGVGLTMPTSPGDVVQLRLAKGLGQLDLSWGGGCSQGQSDYAVYEGALGSWTSHESVQCSTGGQTIAGVSPEQGDRYFLVVPVNSAYEGSYGTDSVGTERLPAAAACLPDQKLRECS